METIRTVNYKISISIKEIREKCFGNSLPKYIEQDLDLPDYFKLYLNRDDAFKLGLINEEEHEKCFSSFDEIEAYIRNKLSPITNLLCMLKELENPNLEEELKQKLKNIINSEIKRCDDCIDKLITI